MRLGLCLCFTTALFAQQAPTAPETAAPATRAATIEKARDKKESALKPEEVSPAERVFRDIRDQKWVERLTGGFNGVRAKVGNMVTGGGFAAGPEYFREDLADGRVSLRLSAQASTRKYTKLEAEGTLRRLWRRRLTFSALASRRDYASLNYYGPGPDSRQDRRSNYRLEDTLAEVFGVVKPWRWATVGASTGALWVNVGPGTDSRYVSTDRLFTESQLPGIQQQTDYLRSSVFGQIDYRDDPNGPKAGGNYVFQYSWYSDRGVGAYGFRRADLDVQQFIPFLNKTRRIALRAKATFTESDGGQRTPFYLQPILGGSDDLRGFRPFRFSDRNMMVYNAEYQWEIFSGLERAYLTRNSERVLGQLTDGMLDTSSDFAVRRRIPRILAHSSSQRAVDGLMPALSDPHFEVRFQVSRALEYLHRTGPGLAFERSLVMDRVERELSVSKTIWQGRKLLDQRDGSDTPYAYLDEVVRDRAQQSLEHVFSLLAIVLPREPLKVAFRALHGNDRILRGLALEYLETTMPARPFELLLAVLESTPAAKSSRDPHTVMEELMASNVSILSDLDAPGRTGRYQ